MKNLCSLLVLFLLGGTILNAQIQKSHWAMHPNEIDFTTTPITNPALGSFSFNYTAGNSAYDPQGNLLFYVYNNHVYDASNNLAGTLTDYFSGPNYPTNIMYQGVEHEIAIVPFSEECEKYYVIYLTPGSEFVNPPNGNNMHQALLYSIVEVSGTTVTVTSQTGTHTSMLIDRFNPGNLGGIAVSPELEEGGRYLFCVAGTEVNRYFIDDSGISFEETIIRIDDMDLESFTFDLTELELYWNGDPDNFEGRLGWGQLNNSMVSTTSAITIDLDISGNYSAHTITNFDDLNSIVGFEFNPDNYDQFFICARDLGGSTGIYWQTINKRGPNYVEDSENYWSHIELARDGEMYIAEYSSGNPASFDPLSTPYFISSTSLSNFKSDQNASFVGAASLHGFFTLPDQIDGVNNTFYLDPVSDFTVNSTSLPNSFSFLPQFNVCQPIIMDDLCENGNSYKVSLVQLNGSGNPIGSPPSQSWSSTLNTNLKNIPYDLFTTLNSSQATGNFKVTVEVKNICGIIDTKVGYFSTIAPFVSFSGLSIGGEYLVTSLPDNDVTQTYSCASQDIILDYNYWNGNQYRVKLESVTSSGSLITGAGELGSKTTSWYSNFASIEDLKDLPLSAPYGTWLTDASHAGYYKVTLSVQRQCGGVDDFVGYFYLNAPPSPANMLLTIHNSQNGTSTCSTKNLNSQCITGNGSPAFSLGISGSTFSTNNITYFKRKIEKIDCITGTIASGPPLYEDASPVSPTNPNSPIIALTLNGLIPGSTFYFIDKFDECYKLTLEVGNACSSSSDWTYFQITDVNNQFRFKSTEINEVASDLTIFPNPVADGLLNIQLKSEFSELTKLRILDYTGRLIQESDFFVNGDFTPSNKQLDISTFSKGIYYLEYMAKGERKIKKFVVQ